MHKIVLGALVCVGIFCGGAISAVSSPRLADQFNPSEFTPQEILAIQRSLTFLGYYQGLWDKDWGPNSAKALSDYAQQRWNESPPSNAAMILALSEAIEISDEIGWTDIPLESFGMSFGVPARYVELNESAPASLEFVGPDLLIRLWWAGRRSIQRDHREVLRGVNPGDSYVVRRDLRWVSSARRPNEWTYLRSDRIGESWVSLYVQGSANVEQLMDYVVSSFDTSADFDVNDGDLIDIVALLEEAAELQEESSAEGSTHERLQAIPETRSGSGFFVSTDEVVTNAHVVEGCIELTTADGSALVLKSQDREEDLALLRYGGASNAYLSIAPDSDVGLGEQVFALGYPLYGTLGKQLNFTSGVVSATQGINDDPDWFTLTAPLQPGNSGGPVLNGDQQVVGVAVAVANATYIAAELDFIPQNVNWAIKSRTLRRFLDANHVAYSTASIHEEDAAAVPLRVQRAVIPVICTPASTGIDVSGRKPTAKGADLGH